MIILSLFSNSDPKYYLPSTYFIFYIIRYLLVKICFLKTPAFSRFHIRRSVLVAKFAKVDSYSRSGSVASIAAALGILFDKISTSLKSFLAFVYGCRTLKSIDFY